MTICIYHGNCADGFTAAWAVRQAIGDVTFIPAGYKDDPPDVAGQDIVIVDFSYKRPTLEALAASAQSVMILDHHKSAAEDLAGLPEPPAHWSEWMKDRLTQQPAICALFDMERSGAGITWDYFHPGEDRPKLIDHVEDRDLWRFNLPGTKEIQACVFSHPYDFEVWDRLVAECQKGAGLLFDQGAAILRKQLKDTAELIESGLQWFDMYTETGAYRVPVINLPYTMGSDAGHMMLDQMPGCDIVAYYWDKGRTRYWGLRGRPDSAALDIAKAYGGGGHAAACGFELSYDAPSQPVRVG